MESTHLSPSHKPQQYRAFASVDSIFADLELYSGLRNRHICFGLASCRSSRISVVLARQLESSISLSTPVFLCSLELPHFCIFQLLSLRTSFVLVFLIQYLKILTRSLTGLRGPLHFK